MEPQRITRRVYEGAETSGLFRITGVRLTPFKPDETFRTQLVDNIEQYESGCRVHPRCFGHMCRTPAGLILPPQSMSMRSMEIVTEYHAAARLAFANNREEYIKKLRETNYGKHGNLRAIMSTPVAGSMRLVARPQWFDKRVIMVSQNLASKLRVCKKVYNKDGIECSTYRETTLQEGDYVIVVRPPSLTIANTQAMKVVFWDLDCLGIHPETFSKFHGDFDGDEAHATPVYDKESIEECDNWLVIPYSVFDDARELFHSLPDHLKGDNVQYDENRAPFIEYTTLSMKQIKDGAPRLVFGDMTRNKRHHINGTMERFNSSSFADSFVANSIQGINDVVRQQLSQGAIGEMSRVARIAASCFVRLEKPGLYVLERRQRRLLVDDGATDPGSPSVRAIANFCAVAQQAALDSHRAETHGPISHDMISDLLLGTYKRKTMLSPTSHCTVVQVDTSIPDSIISGMKPKWNYESGGLITLLCEPAAFTRAACKYLVAAYNPIILLKASNVNKDIKGLCRRGIILICNYYSIGMSEIELDDISAVVSYRPSA
ncbi:uncharacterized protein PV06_11902, partial [Exophiala oligosperma]